MNLTGQYNEQHLYGVDTAYWSYGNPTGKLVVFVHGFRGDHHGLELIAHELVSAQPNVRVVIPDLPGFGSSHSFVLNTHTLHFFAEWLNSFVQSQQRSSDEPFTLVSHSFGTLVAAQALANGLQPAELVLINPIASPALKGPQALMTQLAIAYYKVASLLPEHASRALLGSPIIVRSMSEFMAKTRDRKLRRFIHDQHRQFFSTFQNSETLLQAFTSSVSHTVTEFSDAMNMPTLIIAGENDDISPVLAQLNLHRSLVNSGIEILPGVGHLVHYEMPQEAAQVIGEFISVPQTGAAA